MVIEYDKAQLFTIEGMIAAVMMVGTGLIILNSTTLYTPADTHIYDLQFEQVGNDLLKVLDTNDTYIFSNPPYPAKMSMLENRVAKNPPSQTYNATFNNTAYKYLNTRNSQSGNLDSIQFFINKVAIDAAGKSVVERLAPVDPDPVQDALIAKKIDLVKKTEHLVRATRLVYTYDNNPNNPQVYLVEVYLWR
jgi:hypothetical protein